MILINFKILDFTILISWVTLKFNVTDELGNVSVM